MRGHTQANLRHPQRGAALVIGLILLMVLTLLAVSGMNSASLEYIMAGNEQYRSNAFQAAEAGIEQGLSLGVFNPGAAPEALNGTNPGTAGATDTWAYTITPQLGGAAIPGWGSSANKYSTYHFEIRSTGTSVRGAQALNTQGVMVISPYDPTMQPDPLAATNQLN
jgi:type IV pilus assembly protein PilX